MGMLSPTGTVPPTSKIVRELTSFNIILNYHLVTFAFHTYTHAHTHTHTPTPTQGLT